MAKVCRGEQVSCLFESTEGSGRIREALQIKRPTSCQIWQLNQKSLVSIQDSNFVVGNKFVKEGVKKPSASKRNKNHFLTYKG